MSSSKAFSKGSSKTTKIDTDFRIKIEKSIEKFITSNEQVYEFPSTLNNVERAFVHQLAPRFNLQTKSNGKGTDRCLSLYKPTETSEFQDMAVSIDLSSQTVRQMTEYLKSYTLSCKTNRLLSLYAAGSQSQTSRSPFKAPIIPSPSGNRHRPQLPIDSYQQQILSVLEGSRIVLLQGATGSGKTSRVPQYILSAATQKQQTCRILCTQPRRISAIASAERVAFERNEEVGGTVGYQIRLESRTSPSTSCVFMTPGVLLRYLMTIKPSDIFCNITHIIIDEAHERNKETDFLLTSIRDNLNVNPNLRVVIMSATMDARIFSKYFGGNIEEMTVATAHHHVEIRYLDDVLKMVQFNNKRVAELNEKFRCGKLIPINAKKSKPNEGPVDDETTEYLNTILEAMSTEDQPDDNFSQFEYLVEAENIPADFRHSTTHMTALMIAVGRNFPAMVRTLLSLDADPQLFVEFAGRHMDSLDIAKHLHGDDSEIVKILEVHSTKFNEVTNTAELYNKMLIDIYSQSIQTRNGGGFIVEEIIDHQLIAQLVAHLHETTSLDGGILVFLSGYDDLMQVSEAIRGLIRDGFRMFLLHSTMKTGDQRAVFSSMPRGCRKIVLATNIAESSITIDDIVHVIDSGREKQKTYDALCHSSSLRVQWISKASANQRKGRAGRLRDGICYRVYSRDRFAAMPDTTLPELLRTSLTEICLQTKLLTGGNESIEAFLQRCISVPSIAAIHQSIKLLRALGALDDEERLTVLGGHLAHMPVDASYARMVIYAIALKCLHPILDAVAVLSVGDQCFTLPVRAADRQKSNTARKSLAEASLSDHFVMMRVFQKWRECRNVGRSAERKFCEENFVSGSAMEQAAGIRGQLVQHLEISGLVKDDRALNINSNEWSMVKACFAAGLYPNVARISLISASMYGPMDKKLEFHMSSVLRSANVKNVSDWILFEEKHRVGRSSLIRGCTAIGSVGLLLCSGVQVDHEKIDEDSLLKVDGFVQFQLDYGVGLLMYELRQRLDNFVGHLLTQQRNFQRTNADDRMVDTIERILREDDSNIGFQSVQIVRQQQVQRRQNNYPSGSSKPQQQCRRFFVMCIDNQRTAEIFAAKIVFDLHKLRPSKWLMREINDTLNANVSIFLYAVQQRAIVAIGDVMHTNGNLQFHLKMFRVITLDALRPNNIFMDLIKRLSSVKMHTEEIPANVAASLSNLFN